MKKIYLRPIGRLSRLILHIEMPLIVLQALTVLISYLQMREVNLARALSVYPRVVPYLLFPVLVTVFSVLLIERLESEE